MEQNRFFAHFFDMSTSYRVGKNLFVRNPCRNDNRPGSFNICTETGRFYDHADPSMRGGDLVALYAKIKGYEGSGSMLRAAKEIASSVGVADYEDF